MATNLLASDANNTEFLGASNPDSALAVWFFTKPIQNPFLTAKAGRPIFEEKTYIHIESPGDRNSIIERPVYETDSERFPQHWMAFKNRVGEEAGEVGTPLSAWPLVSKAQAEELRALKFRTVESVANASDANIEKVGMMAGMAPHAFRAKAQAFLAAASNAAAADEKAAENAALRKELDELRASIAAMKAAPVAASAKRKGGWPKGKPRKQHPEEATT